MGCSPQYTNTKGKLLEREVTDGFRMYNFDIEHTGRKTGDKGVDHQVWLFGTRRTVQCGNWDQKTFSFSKFFEKLRRAQIAIFRFNGYESPIVAMPFYAFLDHITWDRPGKDHANYQLRAYLASKGLRPHEIEEACRLA